MEEAGAAGWVEATLGGGSGTAGDLTLCKTELEFVSFWGTSCGFVAGLSSLGSSFFSGCSTFFSTIFSLVCSNSTFSARSSLCTRGRSSRVLPRIIRFFRPREMSSFSSVLMTSCLNKNPDIVGTLGLDTRAGGAGTGAFTGSTGLAAS